MNDTEFEEALKKAVQVCIGDDNDLIRRGDAMNAIREMCRIGCLPSSVLTRKEQREVVLFEALQAVRTVKKAAVPTVDPESLRPMAHIMRGTAQCTHDAGFCSNCKLCIDEDYSTALAKSYSYCPHCGAKFGG